MFLHRFTSHSDTGFWFTSIIHIKGGASTGGDGVWTFTIGTKLVTMFPLLMFRGRLQNIWQNSFIFAITEPFCALSTNGLACIYGQRSRAVAFVSNKWAYKLVILVCRFAINFWPAATFSQQFIWSRVESRCPIMWFLYEHVLVSCAPG